MLVGFAGAKRAGKDVAAAHLVATGGFKRYAFATPLKELCQGLFGLTHDQVDGDSKDLVAARYGITPRRIMQMVGTDCIRTIAPAFWVDAFDVWLSEVREAREVRGAGYTGRSQNVVVSDVRFQNEVDLIHKRGGRVFLLTRECCDVCDRHVSEQARMLRGLDGVIRNEGSMADLCREVDNALNALKSA